MPIVVEYRGSLELDLPAPEDEDNIIAALTHTDRVRSISLMVTSSVLKRLSAIKRPFLELEDLVLLSRDTVPLILPSAFGWGPRLRRLHSTRIAFPALLHLLHSSRNIVDLQLHEVLDHWPFSPEELTNALSGMAQLQALSLHFPSVAKHLSPHARSRIVLPALTRFNFRGISQYLEGLVARINAPRLRDIKVTFFNEFIFELPALKVFVDQIDVHKSHRRAQIILSERAISLSLTRPGAPTCLKFQLFGEQLALQLPFISQICICYSAFLFNVEDLHIDATTSSKWEDPFETKNWLEIINSFPGVKWFHVSGNISTNIVRSLDQVDRWRDPLPPSLFKLPIRQPGPHHASLLSFNQGNRLRDPFLPALFKPPIRQPGPPHASLRSLDQVDRLRDPFLPALFNPPTRQPGPRHASLRSLDQVDRLRDSLLPALLKLHIQQPGPRHASLTTAAMSFMTSRRLSGQPIAVEYGRLSHIDGIHVAGTIRAESYDYYSLTLLE